MNHSLQLKTLTGLSLTGRVALVTGSTTGLGRQMALTLAAVGARVAINYCHNQTRAEAFFAEFRASGGQGILVRADVTETDGVKQLIAEVTQGLGPVDILVLNATCDQPQKPVEEYDWVFFQSMIDYFIKSPFLLTQACLGHMRRQRWGRIINIGSEVVQRGVPNFTAYVAAKGGQNGFHRGLASEVARDGITVNMISPGWIPVERHAADSPEAKAAYLAHVPAQRWGVPSDVAQAVAFLASDAASFITGQNLAVNGGLTVA